MNAIKILTEIKKLSLPKGEFIVYGSAPLAIAGIRESNDVDLFVTDNLLKKLKLSGWEESDTIKSKPAVYGNFEAHNNWKFGEYNPTLDQLLETAQWVEGVPFVSIQEVKKWKLISGRTKDLKDVKLIDEYLAKIH